MNFLSGILGSASGILTDQSAAGQSTSISGTTTSGTSLTSAGASTNISGNVTYTTPTQGFYNGQYYQQYQSGSTFTLPQGYLTTGGWQQYAPADTFSVILHKRLNEALKPEYLPEMLFQKLNEQYTSDLINKLNIELQQDEL